MSNPETIAIGSDHGGVDLKDNIVADLTGTCTVADKGTKGTDSVDYPDFGFAVADAVAKGEAARGILICGTGIGMSIAANKIAGVRAALCHNVETARLSRDHNDANILVLGARVLEDDLAREMVKVWLSTPFGGARHQRRIDKIHALEAGKPAL